MGKQVAARSIKKELVLPVIRESKRFGFLMTDKTSVRSVYIAPQELRSFGRV